MSHGQDSLMKKLHCVQDFFCDKNVPQAKPMQENASQARFFGLNPDGYSVLLM